MSQAEWRRLMNANSRLRAFQQRPEHVVPRPNVDGANDIGPPHQVQPGSNSASSNHVDHTSDGWNPAEMATRSAVSGPMPS